MLIEYIQNGKRITYATEKAVVAEELAALRNDSSVTEVYLNGKRKK